MVRTTNQFDLIRSSRGASSSRPAPSSGMSSSRSPG
jgi:hypothetical protein